MNYKLSRQAKQTQAKWDRVETKQILGMGNLADWSGVSRSDGTNFRTNMVTLAQYMDTPRGNALGLSATYACVNLLAGTIASLPLMVYRTRNGVRSIASDHPLYYVLHDSPNYDQTAVDFWEFACAGLELHGNAFAEIEKRSNGSVYSLTPIRPDVVTVERLNGRLQYRWSEDGKAIKRDQEEILHIRGFGGNPLGGSSTLAACGQTFSGALAAEQAANGMFKNGVLTTGVVSADRDLTKEQMDAAQQRIEEKYAGALNAGRPMVLNNGLQWQQISISPEDAQMLETRRFSVEEICRVFGVPPHMIGHTENSTSWGTGLEQQTLGFQKFTLRRRLKRIEQALQKQLMTPADRAQGISIEFNLEGLLRGDSEGRANFYREMSGIGAMTINEIRALENLPPVPGGDVPRMQMQNVPITQAGQEEA